MEMRHTGIIGRCVIVLMLCWPTIAMGQVTGRFYLEKETFATGEPVFLYFEIKNSGTTPQNIGTSDPYSFCSGLGVHLTPDGAADLSCTTMGGGFIGSCLSSDKPLQPGKTSTERILVNYEHPIHSAGQYGIEAEGSIAYAPATEDFYAATRRIEKIHALIHFSVDENAAWTAADWQPWVERLHSGDEMERREAEITLASLAPRSLEGVLLSFPDEWAPLAFQRLNTPRSMAALAGLVRMGKVGSYEHMKADEILAESGDTQWFPLLLETAEKHPKMANYLANAAESGGDQILPTLIPRLDSSDTELTRPIAISALGYTGSRAAVPILIGLLRTTGPGDAERALAGLRQLSHRDIGGSNPFAEPQSQYPRWLNWWKSEGASATIYKPKDCGEVTPLPLISASSQNK